MNTVTKETAINDILNIATGSWKEIAEESYDRGHEAGSQHLSSIGSGVQVLIEFRRWLDLIQLDNSIMSVDVAIKRINEIFTTPNREGSNSGEQTFDKEFIAAYGIHLLEKFGTTTKPYNVAWLQLNNFIRNYPIITTPNSGDGVQGMKWVSVEDKPLVINTPLGWECTEDGEGEFLAALQYEDSRQPGKSLWWIKYCIIEDGTGLCVIGESDNEPAGWELKDITHYCKVSTPPQSNNNAINTEKKYIIEDHLLHKNFTDNKESFEELPKPNLNTL